MDDEEKLQRLDDFVMAEILVMSSSDLCDLVGEADAVKSGVARVINLAGKAKLVAARAALAGAPARRRVTSLASDKKAAAELQALRARDRPFDRKLTLAARGAGEGADADEAGIKEDLVELDAWEVEEG